VIRAWLRDRGSEIPEWVLTLEAAEEWSQPPWVIEEEAPLLWWERWKVYREERITAMPKPKGKGSLDPAQPGVNRG
jgi:hypothetical protein